MLPLIVKLGYTWKSHVLIKMCKNVIIAVNSFNVCRCMVVLKTNNLGKRYETFLLFFKWRESYSFEDQEKNLLFVVLTQRTCLLSLEEWPNLEIFQHKTILVACKKFQYLIYNTKRYKAIAIQVFTKKKKTWNNTSFSEKQTCREFFVQCICFKSQKRQVSKTRNIYQNQLL